MTALRATAPVAAPTPVEAERPHLRAVVPAQAEATDADPFADLLALASGRRTIERGAALYRCGDPLSSLYAVQGGLFKTCLSLEDGRGQVTGFQLSGEWLGLDAIGSGRHHSDAVALETSQVCSIVYEDLETRLNESGELRHQFRRLMSREIVRGHDMMLLLGGMCAEVRVATFLLDLTQRLHERGSPATTLLLSMTRDEIGSFLGLKLETVSRMLSRLRDLGVLEVTQRHVEILDPPALRRIAHREET